MNALLPATFGNTQSKMNYDKNRYAQTKRNERTSDADDAESI
ncbi:MAG: hypothetical protein WCG98_01105 [bacterium]